MYDCYLEDDRGYEFTVQVSIYSWPAKNGGLTDPSFEAGFEIEEIWLDGKPFAATKEQEEIILNQIVNEMERYK